jgi:hypothetical protein
MLGKTVCPFAPLQGSQQIPTEPSQKYVFNLQTEVPMNISNKAELIQYKDPIFDIKVFEIILKKSTFICFSINFWPYI